jgi:hypothetical protein
LRFDPTAILAQSVSKGALSSDFHFKYNLNVPGELRISLARSTGLLSGGGTLLNVIFDVSSRCRVGDSIPVSLTVATLCDQIGESMPCTAVSGCLEIESRGGDGVPDYWKQRIVDADPHDAITCLADVLPDGDFDNDGVRNADELTADTVPLKAPCSTASKPTGDSA